jgi:cell wall-associated NlpC family hydrolase
VPRILNVPQTRQFSLALVAAAVALVGGVVALGGSRTGSVIAAAGRAADVTAVAPTSSATPVASTPRPAKAVVAVSVAEVWSHHRKVLPVDRPAQQRPARVSTWLHRMTFFQRSHLYRRLATQVRYGELVYVLGTRGPLTHVRIPDQTGGRFPNGIIGWVASRQLAPEPAGWESHGRVATVVAKRAALDRTTGGTTRSLSVSYATTLPVVAVHRHRVDVAVPGGVGWLSRSEVRVHVPGKAALRPSPHRVLAQAKRFLGLPYLWAGMTSWGFDCSGLTATVYSMLGITLPRDAADQSLAGHAVSRRHLRLGDLVFFSHTRKRGDIHHVAIYAGKGRVLQSPYTGAHVEVVKLRHSYLNREYWGATRLLS